MLDRWKIVSIGAAYVGVLNATGSCLGKTNKQKPRLSAGLLFLVGICADESIRSTRGCGGVGKKLLAKLTLDNRHCIGYNLGIVK